MEKNMGGICLFVCFIQVQFPLQHSHILGRIPHFHINDTEFSISCQTTISLLQAKIRNYAELLRRQ